MKKYAILLTFVLISAILLVGCFKPPSIGDIIPKGDNGTPKATDPKKDPVIDVSAGGEAQYEAYIEAKAKFIERIIGAVSQDPDAAYSVFSLMGLGMMDMLMWPAALLWQDEAAAKMTMAFFGANNAKFDRKGDKMTLTFQSDTGEPLSYTGEYLKDRGGYIFTANMAGGDQFYSEYNETSYGYVALFHQTGQGSGDSLILMTFDKEGNGVVGLSEDVSKPAPLTGREPFDYPTSASEWYRIEGNHLTGVSEDGTALDSTYTPSQDNSD